MPSSRIVLTLALLPAILLAPACDDKEVPGPNTGDAADTDDSDTAGETSEGEDTPATGTSEGEGTEGQAGETAPGTDGDESGTAGDSEGDSGGHDTSDLPDEPPEPPPPADKPDAAQPCPDVEWPGEMECTTENGEPGTSICHLVDGQPVWTACGGGHECYPGDGYDQGCLGEICAWDGEKFYWYAWSEPDCNTPLVLDFDGGAPLRFDAATAASFDISGVGECLATDWPTLPWLALDRDGDGAIESGRELFGSGTRLRGGARATDGFEALRELDANFDGRIDAADPAFAELVLWSDGDGDRRGELAELLPVSAVSLVAIDLDVAVRVECDDRGNCGRERSRFEFRTASGEIRSGEVIDVYLACQ